MTINDLYLNERCLEMRKLTDELQIDMRNGDWDALRRKVSRLTKVSDETCVRLNDMYALSQQ